MPTLRKPGEMQLLALLVFPLLLSSVFSTVTKVKTENRRAFLGEDVEIWIPSLMGAVVRFIPSSPTGQERLLLKEGRLLDSRVRLDRFNHLILDDVGEEDEGTYVIKQSHSAEIEKRLLLIVRDCSVEQNVKYAETFDIPVNDVSRPISLEFRAAEANESAGPTVPLLNQSRIVNDDYRRRLSVSERKVSLHGVARADEGAYDVLDSKMKVRKKICLNVKDHQHFVHLPYGGTLKINLYLNRTKVRVRYAADHTAKPHIILDEGELVLPMEPKFNSRLVVEDSMLILERVRVSDKGVFTVADLENFPVSNVHLNVDPYKLPSLYVAIISLLSLVAFLLCVCLISCLLKIRRRAEKARAIARIAQNAGKEEGESFRQVVHEAYARFTEESSLQSQWDSSTERTEVDIKGLEVSKPGQYKVLSPDKTIMETSDSGVEFVTAGNPLDSDADLPPTYESHKLLFDTDTLSIPVPEAKLSNSHTPDSKLSITLTPEGPGSATPEGDLMSHSPPEPALGSVPSVADVEPELNVNATVKPNDDGTLPNGDTVAEQSTVLEKAST